MSFKPFVGTAMGKLCKADSSYAGYETIGMRQIESKSVFDCSRLIYKHDISLSIKKW